jgi:DNA (cytosine-5)-methyltransferase 1
VDERLSGHGPWPRAAYNVGTGRFRSAVSAWPVNVRSPHLAQFLNLDEAQDLSLKAVSGFLNRYEGGALRKQPRFLRALYTHRVRMGKAEGI